MKKIEDEDEEEDEYAVAGAGVSDGSHTFTIRIFPTKKLAEKNSPMPYMKISEILKKQ